MNGQKKGWVIFKVHKTNDRLFTAHKTSNLFRFNGLFASGIFYYYLICYYNNYGKSISLP